MTKGKSLFAHLTLFILTILCSARAGIILLDLGRILQLLIFLIIWYAMIISVFAGYKDRNNAYPALTLLYSLNLFNIILMIDLIKYKPISYLLAIIFSVIGIFAAALYASKVKKVCYIEFPLDLTETTEVLEKQDNEEIKENQEINQIKPKVELPKIETKVIKTFTPSKYIASKTSEKFHSPKCNWAKKINKNNIVWLKDKEEAESKGFKKCELCIE